MIIRQHFVPLRDTTIVNEKNTNIFYSLGWILILLTDDGFIPEFKVDSVGLERFLLILRICVRGITVRSKKDLPFSLSTSIT